jgi:hypothetical protein
MPNIYFYGKTILLGILAIILTACNIDFKIPANQEIHIAFPQSGHAAGKLQIDKSKQLIVTVNSWLSTHQSNWEIGLVTRPHGIYF